MSNRDKVLDGLLEFLTSEDYERLHNSNRSFDAWYVYSTIKKTHPGISQNSVSYHLRRFAEEGILELTTWSGSNGYKIGVQGMPAAVAKIRMKKSQGRRSFGTTTVELRIEYPKRDVECFNNIEENTYIRSWLFLREVHTDEHGYRQYNQTDYIIPKCGVYIKGVKIGNLIGSHVVDNESVTFQTDYQLDLTNKYGIKGLRNATYNNIQNFIKKYSKKNWEKLDKN